MILILKSANYDLPEYNEYQCVMLFGLDIWPKILNADKN